jgi:hypothetical protein
MDGQTPQGGPFPADDGPSGRSHTTTAIVYDL